MVPQQLLDPSTHEVTHFFSARLGGWLAVPGGRNICPLARARRVSPRSRRCFGGSGPLATDGEVFMQL